MTAPEFKAPSPAKINRFLHVTGRREDGYHRLQSLFQFLDHGDLLTFRPDTSGTIRREDRHRFQLPQDDLCVRAATWLRESAERPDLGVEIVLEKNIPPGSGLGAGSSNAATTLLALNRLWSLDLSDDRLLEIARRLGADVPVFLHGEAAWAEGAGDELSACAVDEPWLALLIPRAPVSTAEAFNDPALRRDHAPVTREDFTSGRTGNDLEPVTFRRHPAVALAHDYLARYGHARMSGTGGAVFVPQESRAAAERVVAAAPQQFRRLVTRARNRSPLVEALSDW